MNLSGRTLLAVFAHPDDESIACGGLLARCAAAGARVVLLCATHGENRSGHRDPSWFETRAQELQRAAEALGVSEVVLLDYPDGFLPWIDVDEFEARIVAEIGRVNPDVVITFGDDGLYWHPDHIAVHERTTAAVASLGDAAPALYYATIPPGQMRKVVDEWRTDPDRVETSTPLFGIGDADAFGVWANPPTLVVDVSDAAIRKLTALKCHQTQVAHGAFARLRDDAAARLLGIEHFHRSPIASNRDAFIERL
jgi:LmbE family N-acetylglucosaminyl deacetylase